MHSALAIVVCLLWSSRQANGHGRLLLPPSRSSMWRYPDDPAIAPYYDIVEPNFDDNQLFCGGSVHQESLGGKCGVCGDPYDAAVKDNEAGGKYAKGIIVRQYPQGSIIDVTIEITAHHKGYFEFRLCPWNDQATPITHECLNQYLLGTPVDTKWMLPTSSGGSSQFYHVKVKLPDDVECDQCVLQWRYHTGNTWKCDDDGTCCAGCGHQEEFYGCADIAIGTGPTLAPPGLTATTTTKAGSAITTEFPSTTKSTTSTITTKAPAANTTTTPGDPNDPCPSTGPGYHVKDCDTFYQCNGSDEIVTDCPPGTVFDETRGICDFAYNVPPPCGTKA